MKRILLAKKGKRLLARLIDFLLVIIITLFIFLVFVFPMNLNVNQIEQNGKEINQLYENSGLFFVDEAGNYCAKSAVQTVKDIDDLYSFSYVYNNVKYDDVSLTKTLFIYYTEKFNSYGSDYNLSIDTYNSDILKLGTSESNIQSYDYVNNCLELIDDDKSAVTINYFLSIYSKTCANLIDNSKIKELTSQNQQIIMNAVVLIVPVVIIVSFIFDLLVPLLSPCCESIGKYIYHLGVLSHDGYRLKKWRLIPRWICYVLFELILGIITFGATVLITYTMFLFCKKRRCLHDFIAKSVVIEKDGSIYFATKEEENFYIERQKNRG